MRWLAALVLLVGCSSGPSRERLCVEAGGSWEFTRIDRSYEPRYGINMMTGKPGMTYVWVERAVYECEMPR